MMLRWGNFEPIDTDLIIIVETTLVPAKLSFTSGGNICSVYGIFSKVIFCRFAEVDQPKVKYPFLCQVDKKIFAEA